MQIQKAVVGGVIAVTLLASLAKPSAALGELEAEPPLRSHFIAVVSVNHPISSPTPVSTQAPVAVASTVAPTVAPTPSPVAQKATKATVTPKSTASTESAAVADVKASIVKWADYYGVSSERMLRVANCESGYQQYVVNRAETPGNSPSGIFQFKPQTFYGNAKRVEPAIESPDLWNVEHQAQVAAWMFSIGQSVQWACK